MRFGVFLPTYWDDYGSTPIHVAINEAALAAEALGYEGVWANDEVITRQRTRVARSSSRSSPWPAWCTWCRA